MSVSVVITSCNRPHLLKNTLESFLKFNTFPIEQFIIVEDSGMNNINDFVLDLLDKKKTLLIYNETNIGQVKSIDKAYANVKTDYIFHCEEDWEFLDYGFIERSLQILNTDPKIFTVWLRPHNDTSLHPIIKTQDLGGFYKMDPNYSYIYKNTIYTWCGFTFNPGLRRTSDCMLFYPYSNCKKTIYKSIVSEYDVNINYRELGFYAVITDKIQGYVKHIGWKEPTKRPTDFMN